MRNIFLKEHAEMVPFFKEASLKGDYVLVNVDAHADMGMFLNGKLDIGNFITYCVKEKYFSKILWIKDDNSIEFEDGFYEFNMFWDDELLRWKCDLEHFGYFLEDSFVSKEEYSNTNFRLHDYAPNEQAKFYGLASIQLEVISEKNLAKSRFAGLNWVLSIDCDFFSAANPFKSEFTKVINEIGQLRATELVNKVLKIKTYSQWIDFKKELAVSKEWQNASNLARYTHIETDYDEQEIDKKILNVLSFLKNNFAREKCLAALTCLSFFSGYTPRKKCPKIVSIIDTVFKNFDFFWENA